MNPLPTTPAGRLRLAALAAAVAAALALAACSKGDAKAAAGEQHAEQAGAQKDEDHEAGEHALALSRDEVERAGIRVEPAGTQAAAATVVVTATIQPDPDRLARVAPRIEGRITAAPAKLGERVRAGQVLATLDSVAVGEAHAAWAQAQAELRIAEADLERAKLLAADEIIARKDFVRAQAERDKAAATLRAAADRLRLLGGRPGAGGSTSGFVLTAPFAGTVIAKKATLGDLAGPSEPLFTIADLSRVWIQADLPEAALAKVRVGARATLGVPAYPGETFDGRVGYVGAVLDKDTRTVPARIEVANADGRLKPEMFATAVIEAAGATAAQAAQAISLPDAAIVLLEGRPTVFVFDAGAYEPREVDPGERFGGRTLLKGGVQAGEQVVVAGAYALKARKLKSQLGHGH